MEDGQYAIIPTPQDEKLDLAAIKERAQQLEPDQQAAFTGCATDNIQCAMRDLVNVATHKDKINSTELINDYNWLTLTKSTGYRANVTPCPPIVPKYIKFTLTKSATTTWRC